MSLDHIIHAARDRGPVPTGAYRVVIIESDARVTTRDHDNLADAKEHANDAAGESDSPPPLAYVLDQEFKVVHRGRPYFAD